MNGNMDARLRRLVEQHARSEVKHWVAVTVRHGAAKAEVDLPLPPDWYPMYWRPEIKASLPGLLTHLQVRLTMDPDGPRWSVAELEWEAHYMVKLEPRKGGGR